MHEQGTISIHTENIFPIIKKSLYSDREIFLRELVSNGVDAISKLKMVSYGSDQTLPDPKIEITIDREQRQLVIRDTGLGMTAEEVKKYINQVAFSSATEFAQKYQGEASQQIIGHFGLGFYSAFMVADQVEINTLSYQPESQPVRWTCDGSTAFSLTDGDRQEIGTTITLSITEDADEYLEVARIRQLITKYCDFLPVPISLNGDVVNRQKPLWTTSPSELKSEDYLEFYRYLHPFEEDPLFWIHINTDYPFLVQGILYFPKLKPDIDPNRGQIKLFCNQVFVSDHCEEVIPKFLLPLRGALDSPDIPLNVSRSFLQNDRTVQRIADHIAKKVGDRLQELARDDYDQYLKAWTDIGLFMKFGALNSDKFYQQIKDILIYETAKPTEVTEGQDKAYVTLNTYLERNRDSQGNTVYYASDATAQKSYIDLHQSQNLEVLILDGFIDSHFTSFLEQQNPDLKFRRVDSELADSLINQDPADDLVDPGSQKNRSEQLVELFQKALGKPKLTIKAESLKSEAVPAMILLPEALRRMQELTALMQQQGIGNNLLEDHTLIVNMAHPMVRHLLRLTQQTALGDDDLPQLICHHIYDLALMTQKNPDPATIQSFAQRSNAVLTRLMDQAIAS